MKDEEGEVDQLLRAVVPQLHAGDEYVVVDDASADGTRALLDEWSGRDPRIRVVEGPGINVAAARNVAFSHVHNEVVASIDAGCVPVPGWLEALRSPFGESDPVEVVVGVFSAQGGSRWTDAVALACFAPPSEHRRRTPVARAHDAVFGRRCSPTRVDTRSMAATVDAWRKAGGFDESLRATEDAVFGEAVRRSGGRLVLSLDAEVAWKQPPTPRGFAATFARYGEWDARSGSRGLVARDLTRAGAYAVAPVVALTGGRIGRVALLVGAAAYAGPAMVRARRARADAATYALVPVAIAVKDVAKAWGAVRGLLARGER